MNGCKNKETILLACFDQISDFQKCPPGFSEEISCRIRCSGQKVLNFVSRGPKIEKTYIREIVLSRSSFLFFLPFIGSIVFDKQPDLTGKNPNNQQPGDKE